MKNLISYWALHTSIGYGNSPGFDSHTTWTVVSLSRSHNSLTTSPLQTSGFDRSTVRITPRSSSHHQKPTTKRNPKSSFHPVQWKSRSPILR